MMHALCVQLLLVAPHQDVCLLVVVGHCLLAVCGNLSSADQGRQVKEGQQLGAALAGQLLPSPGCRPLLHPHQPEPFGQAEDTHISIVVRRSQLVR